MNLRRPFPRGTGETGWYHGYYVLVPAEL